MAGIDIFSIQPSVVSRDLSGYSFTIYGMKKSGKTSNAVKFPKPLLLAFEKGYSTLSGVKALPINSWTDATKAQSQLVKDAKAVEKGEKPETFYKTVIIDTADLAWSMCERYILAMNGVTHLDETENKKGYKQLEKTFENWFLELIRYNYTVIFISHSDEKQIKDKRTGEKINMIVPTMEKRCAKVVTRACDIIAFASSEYDENNKVKMTLTLRGTPELEAGSRFKYQSEQIPFTYEALKADILQAIEKQEAEGETVVDEKTNSYKPLETFTFDEVMKEVRDYGKRFNDAGKISFFNEIAEKHLGAGAKLTQAKPSQQEAVEVAMIEIKNLAEELNI